MWLVFYHSFRIHSDLESELVTTRLERIVKANDRSAVTNSRKQFARLYSGTLNKDSFHVLGPYWPAKSFRVIIRGKVRKENHGSVTYVRMYVHWLPILVVAILCAFFVSETLFVLISIPIIALVFNIEALVAKKELRKVILLKKEAASAKVQFP
jgi:hypothetical protein